MKIGTCPICQAKITKSTVNGVATIDKSKFRQVKVVYDITEDVASEDVLNEGREIIKHELQGPICKSCFLKTDGKQYEDIMRNDPPVKEMMMMYPKRKILGIELMPLRK